VKPGEEADDDDMAGAGDVLEDGDGQWTASIVADFEQHKCVTFLRLHLIYSSHALRQVGGGEGRMEYHWVCPLASPSKRIAK
jgi:hypothetical protein